MHVTSLGRTGEVSGQTGFDFEEERSVATSTDESNKKHRRGNSELQRQNRQQRSEKKFAQRALVAATGIHGQGALIATEAAQIATQQPAEALGVGREGTSQAGF
jgi:hypothetical protein